MFAGSREIDAATEKLNEAFRELLKGLVDKAVDRLIEVTEDFAPDETDFNVAIYVPGPEGDHSLIAVEDEIVDFMRSRPHLVDAMRLSEEFDNDALDDLWRAGRAVVNESLALAEMKWRETYPTETEARFNR